MGWADGSSDVVEQALDNIDAMIKEVDSAEITDRMKAVLAKKGKELAEGDGSTSTHEEQEAKAKQAISWEVVRGLNEVEEWVTEDLFLPTRGKYRAEIHWASSLPDFISTQGKVKRPAAGASPVSVILTYTLVNPGSQSGSFAFSVPPETEQMTEREKLREDWKRLTFEVLNRGANVTRKKIVADLRLPEKGDAHGSSIDWSSDDPGAIRISGKAGKVLRHASQDKTVTLTAVLEREGEEPFEKYFRMKVLSRKMPDAKLLAEALDSLRYSDILGGNLSPSQIDRKFALPLKWLNGTSVAWQSSLPEAVGHDGSVTRTAKDQTADLTATLTLGSAVAKKTFGLTVIADTGLDAVTRALGELTFPLIRGNNLTELGVVDDLLLTKKMTDGVAVAWKSSEPETIDADGFVTRSSSDKNVVLTATLSKNSVSRKKQFQLVVPRTGSSKPALERDFDLLTFDFIAGENPSAQAVSEKLELVRKMIHGSDVDWTIDKLDVITSYGFILKPPSDTRVTLTARLTKDGRNKSKTFIVTVLAKPAVAVDPGNAHPLLDAKGQPAQAHVRLNGKLYRVKLFSGIQVLPADVVQNESIELDLGVNQKRFREPVRIAKNYFNSNVRFVFYDPSQPGPPEAGRFSHFVNQTKESLNFSLDAAEAKNLSPPAPNPDQGVETLTNPPVF